MDTSVDTITHIYADAVEILHVMTSMPKLRVRWLENNTWILRWDAILDDHGQYQSLLLDGLLKDCHPDALLAAMAAAAQRLPNQPVSDLAHELSMFTVD